MGSGQCPSALSPAQQGELDPPPGKERIQHVPPPVPLSHGPFIGVPVLNRVMLSAPCSFSCRWQQAVAIR